MAKNHDIAKPTGVRITSFPVKARTLGVGVKSNRVRIPLLFLFCFFLIGPAFSQPSDLAENRPRVAQVEEENYAERLEGLAQSLLLKNDFAEARKIALELLRVEPSSKAAKVVLAKASIASGDLGEAQVLVSKLLKSDPKDPDFNVLQGMVYMLGGKPQLSIPFLEKGLEFGQSQRSPDQLASYANTLVLALHQQGDFERALTVCLDSLEKYPAEPDLYLTCSRLYRERKSYDLALDIAQKGLKLDPDFRGLYASVALAEAGLGHDELSEKAYRELLSRDPELASALRQTLDGIRADKAEMQVRVE